MSTAVGEWKWYGGPSEEVCTFGPCDTKEQVIQEAIDDQSGEFQAEDGKWMIGVHVCEARKDPLHLSRWLPEIDWLLEHAEDGFADSDRASEYDDGGVFQCTVDQQRDLERRLKAACDEWQEANGLQFKAWTFSDSRNHEHVVVDHPAEPKP